MDTSSFSPLAALEARLRPLIPPDLFASVWLEPSSSNLTRVFEHLRTLQRILFNYVPRHVAAAPPQPGQLRLAWQEGALMFTDLAGFTSLVEANAVYGPDGAATLLSLLNSYFAQMLEIASKSGGDLLEFTGDSMLIQFPSGPRADAVTRAIRAGLRMQRAMDGFANIATPHAMLSLGMRIGIHSGRYLTADIGTPSRMENVLIGVNVQRTKQAESSGRVGRVCVSEETYALARNAFRADPGAPGHVLICDDLSLSELGEYEVSTVGRQPNTLLLDRSRDGLLREIGEAVAKIEPLACYFPTPILQLLIKSAARRRIAPTFPELTVAFVSLTGISEAVSLTPPKEAERLVGSFSALFAKINAAVICCGGILKNVTYHQVGSDMLIYFGVPDAYTNDACRTAETALAIRDLIGAAPPLPAGDTHLPVSCQIGLARGPGFVAEIGEPRGRREFNVLGDAVNTAARLMNQAAPNQILLTESLYQAIAGEFCCTALPPVKLKGKSGLTPIYALDSARNRG